MLPNLRYVRASPIVSFIEGFVAVTAGYDQLVNPTSHLVNGIPCERIMDVVLLRAMALKKLETIPVFFRTSFGDAGYATTDVSSNRPHCGGKLLRVTTPLGAIR